MVCVIPVVKRQGEVGSWGFLYRYPTDLADGMCNPSVGRARTDGFHGTGSFARYPSSLSKA